MDKHYDLTYLHQVFHGQEAKVRRIVALFVARAEVLDRQMMACIRQSRLFDLHPVATTLSAGVRMLGLTELGAPRARHRALQQRARGHAQASSPGVPASRLSECRVHIHEPRLGPFVI